MISSFDDRRLLLIRQTDHSEVVGFFAAHWGNDRFERPRPWPAVVLAAQEHDKAWTEWELKPTINAEGHPIDYLGSRLPGSRIEGVLDAFVKDTERLIAVDPYAGLVSLMHAVGLVNRGYGGLLKHMPDRTKDPGGQEFVEEREQRRKRLLEELRSSSEYGEYASEEHIWQNYHLMEIFDLMGQFFCNRYPLTSEERTGGPQHTLSDVPVPLRYGGEQTPITITIVDDFRAVIDPYPFDMDPLQVPIPGRLVSKEPYASQAEFLRDYYNGERVLITYTLQSSR
ncbi:MAG TPA: DUF3891 family protein [Dehalococcoidia bacterium]|nr:DUF3891 family protein [Dehalococcoidia bacterium]